MNFEIENLQYGVGGLKLSLHHVDKRCCFLFKRFNIPDIKKFRVSLIWKYFIFKFKRRKFYSSNINVHYFVIISPCKRLWSFTLLITNFDFLYPMMLCLKLIQICPVIIIRPHPDSEIPSSGRNEIKNDRPIIGHHFCLSDTCPGIEREILKK